MTCCKRLAFLVFICLFLVSSLGINFCYSDTTSDSVTIVSPTEGTTYATNSIQLHIRVYCGDNLNSATIYYSVDNVQHSFPNTASARAHGNIVSQEATLYKLSEGEHTIVARVTGYFFGYPPFAQELDPVTVHFFLNLTQTPVPTQTHTPTTTPTPTQANPNFPLNQSSLTAIGIGAVIVAVTAISLIYLKKHRKTANLKQ